MNEKNIIRKIKKYNLLGRSGSGFPTGLKWDMVKKAKGERKYIICNGSEGEPNVFKDGFILENYPEEVVQGIKIALKTIDNSVAYIYLRKDYYQKFKKTLEKLIKNSPITLFKKTGGYLAGEETSICEAIEGKRPEPRIKPPFPSQSGLFGCPTLINNLETFYCVSQIAKNKYNQTRFYSISGDVKNKGAYKLPENLPIEQVLKETKNWPNFDFFIQVGGGASGEILLSNELKRQVTGQGAIIVFNRRKTNPFPLMKQWTDFFLAENCDKCLPCREGIYRLAKMIEKKKVDRKLLEDMTFVLKETSFCGLGKISAVPFNSLVDKLL